MHACSTSSLVWLVASNADQLGMLRRLSELSLVHDVVQESIAQGLMQTCSTASFLPVSDLHAQQAGGDDLQKLALRCDVQLALGQLAHCSISVGTHASMADLSKSKLELSVSLLSELCFGPNGHGARLHGQCSVVLQQST